MRLNSELMMQLLRGVLEAWGEEEEDGKYSQVRSYSGRFMYGRNCIGVVLSNRGPFELGVMLASQLAQMVTRRDHTLGLVSRETESLLSDLSEIQVRQDSMGMNTIIYFPEFEWLPNLEEEFYSDEEDEEEEDEEDNSPQ